MMPIALGGLSAFLALFWATGFAAAGWLGRRGHPLWLALPLCLAITEWLRGNILTGFPWGVFGQVTDAMGGVEQLASVVGMTGLTLLVWLWSASIFGMERESGARRKVAAAILLSLPLAFAWGEWRLASNPTRYVDGITLRLVQPNISQNDKWRAGNARAIYDQLLAMTAAPSATGKPVTHVIWPESSVPFRIDESPEGRAELAKALGPGQILLAGAVRRDAPDPSAHYYTSILVINSQAEILSHYDKWRLVPGGEFLPLEWLLAPMGLRKVVSLPESFTPGDGPRTMPVPGAGNAGFSVCYEAIFPGAVADPGKRPDWLVNVTNDGWFGKSTGPYQHLAQLRMRTIELGVPAARAANTGISAIIDPLGRIVFASQLDTTGSYDFLLPEPIPAGLYAHLRELMFIFLIFCTFSLGETLRKV